MPKVSIIVPVYKVEKYISRCIESILNQSYTDWELILIDDGSPDKSGEICDQYAAKDNRIRVFHKINSGVGETRNLGIKKAEGEWLLFIDSDDFVNSQYVSSFFNHAVDNSILVIQGLNNISEIGTVISRIEFDPGDYEGDIMFATINKYNLFNFGGPYCKLYNKSNLISNRIQFPVQYSYGEDSVFFFKYLKTINTIRLSGQCGYNYVRYNGNTLSTKDHRIETVLPFIEDTLEDLTFFDKNRIALPKYGNNLVQLMVSSLLNMYRLGYAKSKRLYYFDKTKNSIIPILNSVGIKSFTSRSFICILNLLSVKVLDLLFTLFKLIRIRKK